MIFFNVILAYGMETAFFRFYNKETNKTAVVETTSISIFWTSFIFLVISLLSQNTIAKWSGIEGQFITYTIWILVLDALVIVPFSKLRVNQQPIRYAIVKIGNVAVNLFLNIFFLISLPAIEKSNPEHFLSIFYIENFQIGYMFVSNIVASVVTFLVLSPT